MKTIAAIFVLCVSVLPAAGTACEPGPPNVKISDAIFIGYVTGERWPDLEAEYAGGKKASDVGNARGYPMLVVRVLQTEPLKGRAPKVVEATSPCGLPFQPGDRVVVNHINEEYRVYPAQFTDGENAVRETLRNR